MLHPCNAITVLAIEVNGMTAPRLVRFAAGRWDVVARAESTMGEEVDASVEAGGSVFEGAKPAKVVSGPSARGRRRGPPRNRVVGAAMRVPTVAAFVLATGPGWAASARLVSTEVGRDAPIGVYAVVRRDCSVGTAPDIRIIRAPAHGAIMVQDIRLAAKRPEPCTAVVAPARQVVYRPAAGFSGRDEVMFEIVDRATGQSDPHPVTIVVQPSPTGI